MQRMVQHTGDARLDIAVIGGGLCGLALARNLRRHGREVSVFEARTRLGGRIEADRDGHDLGAAWFWPETQPLMQQLVRELGLRHRAQHEHGRALLATAADLAAEPIELGAVQSGARTMEGGMGRLVDALAQDMPGDRLHLGYVLTAVRARTGCVELHFLCGGRLHIVTASRVVLALPPRLVAERVRFEPPLSPTVRRALLRTPTWMATEAKVVVSFEEASWRDAGYSGNAFVCHDDAVLDELFDACDARGESAALGGFVALSPAERGRCRYELPSLIRAQAYRDWSTETFTCSLRDRREPAGESERALYGAPELRRARWEERLFFGGSETSEIEGGYLEGALHAAARITRELTRLDNAPAQTVVGSHKPAPTERVEPYWARPAMLIA
jgi:monoamine oxidase